MNYYRDFKRLKAYLDIDNKKISEITGLSESMVAKSVSEKHFSRYLKLTVWVFKKMLKE